MYKHIIFDLDGTLTDPAAGIFSSLTHTLKLMGEKEPDKEILKQFIGPGLVDSFKFIFHFSEEKTQEAIRIYRKHHEESGLFENQVYPGMEQLLKALYEDRRNLYVASMKMSSFAQKVLQHFHLNRYFTKIIGFTEGKLTVKKDMIASILADVPANEREQAVMVGDRKFDLLGAKANGLDTIACAYGYGIEEELMDEKPTYLVHSVEELTQILLGE